MKFQAPKLGLSEAIGHVTKAAASGRADAAALAGVKVTLDGNQLHLVCTNGEQTISDSLTVNGTGSGVRLIPARVLADVIRSMPGEVVDIDCGTDEGADVKVTGNGASFSLRTLAAAGFPRSETTSEEGTTVDASQLITALRRVVPAASKDESRGVLQGVLIAARPDGIRLAATDSYRLAVVDVKGPSALSEEQQVVVPASALDAVIRLFGAATELTLRFGTRSLTVESGSLRLTTRLLEGQYPPYERVIPADAEHQMVVLVDVLADAIKRARIVSGHEPIRLELDPVTETATVAGAASDIGAGEQVVSVSYDGDAVSVSFNADYLLAGLDACPTDSVRIGVLDPLKPVKIGAAEDNGGFTYVVMPVRA